MTFVGPAEELTRWAGVPHRSDENVTGFQRLEHSGRVQRAKEFFDILQNQSPTALILGFHATFKHTPGLSVKFGAGDGPVRPCTVTIHRDVSVLDVGALAAIVKAQVKARLEGDAAAANPIGPVGDQKAETQLAHAPAGDAIEQEQGAAASDSPGNFEGEETDDDDDDDDDDEIELGRSLLHRLTEHLDDPSLVLGQLQRVTRTGKTRDGHRRAASPPRRGACERAIPFVVCAIVDCSWPEQVFQFTVVNYTAKGIPDQFITANAALSLTRSELQRSPVATCTRAKVKVIEYQLMRVVHFDQISPFYGLVNLTEAKDFTRIGYKTMVKVAKVWYQGRHDALRQLIPAL